MQKEFVGGVERLLVFEQKLVSAIERTLDSLDKSLILFATVCEMSLVW